jgi:integrase/recombinase XerD
MSGLQPRLHLPFSRWPSADKLLWQEATSDHDDPFDDAAGAHLSERSRRRYFYGWRRFLGFLTLEEPVALAIAPAERLTKERIKLFVCHLEGSHTPHSVAIQVDALYRAARIMMPKLNLGWLKAIKARLYATAPTQGATGPVITSVQLLELGQQLMDESAPPSDGPMGLADAVQYRDGLMIALLAFVPLRRKNLAALEIDRHLVREEDAWFIVVPAEETKTRGTTIDFAIPEVIQPYLTTYLNIIRPRMLKLTNCMSLWVSPKGGALSYSAIWPIITRHAKKRLGIHIAPHDARDAAATTWAIAAPDQINVSRDLLAHSDLRNMKHYNRARGIEASRTHALFIRKMRRAADS